VCSSVFTRTFKEGRIMMDIIKSIEAEQIRKDLPQFNVGDTIQVFYKVTEGSRERIQVFEGTVLKMQGEGSRKTFTVRRISYGIGVERTFPINSPRIDKITVVRKGKVRRAKLYYLRDRQGKSAKVKEKRFY
jgi:large subunit ribosomal protein L19